MGLSRRLPRITGLALLLAAGALLGGCASQLKQTPFDPAGPVAASQLQLLKLTLYFAIGIGTVVTVALLYVVFRFRQKGNDNSIPAQIHGSTKLEITWTIIPIIILAIVAVPTVKTAFATMSDIKKGDLEVKVIGHQWWWEFQYPDGNVVTANELYIPVDKDVRLTLTSNDVIHSFWVPKLAGKTDVIPGRENHSWFRAERAETFYAQCAELCGTSHANMHFRVVAVSQQEFDAWMAARKAGAKTPTDPKALAGKALVEGAQPDKANCIACHTIDGTKAQGKVGPNLSNIGSRTTLAAGTIDHYTEEQLKQWIRNPQSIKPGVIMPQHPLLSDEELDSIVAYLRGLK